jgi:hypothetical protein
VYKSSVLSRLLWSVLVFCWLTGSSLLTWQASPLHLRSHTRERGCQSLWLGSDRLRFPEADVDLLCCSAGNVVEQCVPSQCQQQCNRMDQTSTGLGHIFLYHEVLEPEHDDLPRSGPSVSALAPLQAIVCTNLEMAIRSSHICALTDASDTKAARPVSFTACNRRRSTC